MIKEIAMSFDSVGYLVCGMIITMFIVSAIGYAVDSLYGFYLKIRTKQ